MLTEYNTLNWLRFIKIILNDKDCTYKINKFILRNSHGPAKETSARIYNRYCK